MKEGQPVRDLIPNPTEFLTEAILLIASEQNAILDENMRKHQAR